jgi:uncharacterized protein YodC (DUF2158 family)
MAKTWKPGDKVKLASGGPEMTVEIQWRQMAATEDTVACQWFDKNNDLKSGNFHPDSLVPAK